MKKLIFLVAVSSAVFLTSFIDKSNPDYDEMAQDLCDCVNKSSTRISDELKKIIIRSELEGSDLETTLTNYIINDLNPDSAMVQVEALVELGDKMGVCSEELEKKYQHIYTTETESEVLRKTLAILKAKQGCEFTYAIMQIGAKAIEADEKEK